MRLFVPPAAAPLLGTVDPPSSKNYTTRFILVACLAQGRSVIHKPAVQEDAVALVHCCRQFGAHIVARRADGAPVDFSVANAASIDRLEVEGFGGQPRTPEQPVDPANAGTVLRLLLATAVLCDGPVTFETKDFAHSLGKRPNRHLLDALRLMGVEVSARGDEGMLPIRLHGGRERLRAALAARRRALDLAPHEPVPIPVSASVSSQFASALLFLAPLLDDPIAVRIVDELRSEPLIDTTLAVLRDSGVHVTKHEIAPEAVYPDLVVEPAGYTGRTCAVNGDWPGSAAIFAAAAAVPGSDITVRRLHRDEQGEKLCLEYFADFGCRAEWLGGDDGVRLRVPHNPAFAYDGTVLIGDLCTDAVLAMMGAAAVAPGMSTFTGIGNLQFKECDRVREPIAELRRVAGADAIARWLPDHNPDAIEVQGRLEGFSGGIEVDGRGDHRVIMMLSIVALRCRDGLTITGAEHVAKSFPGWFDTLRALGIGCREV